MILQKVRIENFKGISEPVEIFFRNFNMIVGQNDAGKSTILKAIDCFLNDNSPKPDDSNNRTESSIVSIALFFDPNDIPIVIDGNIETTFKNEELVNEEGLLELKKEWDVSKSQVRSETFIKRKKYNTNDFILLTEPQLIKVCNDLNISTRKGNDNEYNNTEKREKLRESNRNNNITFVYDFDKFPTSGASRLKEIFDATKKVLPRFEYFKADTSLSETDTTIQNFFKKLVEKTIREEIDTNEIEENISNKIGAILEKITAKINAVIGDDEAVEPVIDFDWTKLVQTSFKSTNTEGNIPLKSRGDGFRRVTMMSYFEYLAEQEKSEKQNILFGFEEPETFLHPTAQEKLFAKLKNLCENGYQVILSSHSAILVANTEIKDLIHIYKENSRYVAAQNITDVSSIARDLGISIDNQFVTLFDKAKVLFLVEGIDDATAFQYISTLYKASGEIANSFDELDIAIIPIGGCGSIQHWVSLNLLQTLNKPYFIYLDSDLEDENRVSPNLTTLQGLNFVEGADFLVTKKRMLENYIPPSALNRIVENANITYGDFDHVKNICATHPLAGYLGGRGVVERHFKKLTFDEIKSTFFDGTEDEFLIVYNLIMSKMI